MTWQDSGANPAPGGPGGPDADATRADWDLAQLDALVGDGGAASGPPAPAPGPSTPAEPPAPPLAPGFGSPAPAPGYTPGYGGPSPAPGYGGGAPAPGYAPAPDMAWAPPPTYGAPGGPGGGLEYAGVLVRFVAWMIDGILVGLVGFAISWVLSAALIGAVDWTTLVVGAGTGVPPFDTDLAGRFILATTVAAVLSAAIDLAYFVLLWSGSGRATLGMRIFGLEIGNSADGRTLARGQAFRRWLAMGTWASILGALPVIGGLIGLGQIVWYLVLLISTASNDRRMGLHDQFAGTAIVQRAGESRSGLAMTCLVIVVLLFLVVPVIAIISLLALGTQVETILSTVGESV